jgi:hypothetical protein
MLHLQRTVSVDSSRPLQKAANKIYATFEERRMLSGHLFWNERAWHFFYFDNHDQAKNRNHWAGGPYSSTESSVAKSIRRFGLGRILQWKSHD